MKNRKSILMLVGTLTFISLVFYLEAKVGELTCTYNIESQPFNLPFDVNGKIIATEIPVTSRSEGTTIMASVAPQQAQEIPETGEAKDSEDNVSHTASQPILSASSAATPIAPSGGGNTIFEEPILGLNNGNQTKLPPIPELPILTEKEEDTKKDEDKSCEGKLKDEENTDEKEKASTEELSLSSVEE